jgi:1-aminocyclopropane-1-carboxylate deaminase/D-cysteine desulfhydrase-like pyridoxal-dependent ACC family enzyme
VTPVAFRRRAAPIFAEFPELERKVPWRPLVEAPTRVEPASAIEGYLGRSGVFHKRDDQISPLYGGNKIRRFEYLLADAEQRGARHLITAGGLASTQVMATVLFGQALGFKVTAALFDQPVTAFAREALLTGVAGGGTLIYGGGYLATALGALRARHRAERPYLILPGASTPMANLGYVDALLELGEQVRRGEVPRPDVIVVPAGSGGTLAGLAVGVSILRWPTLLIGVRITEAFACNRATIRLLIESTARYLQKRAGRATRSSLTEVRFALHHGAIGAGYGYPTREAIEAIPEVERLIGIRGEVTYSGKGLSGLRAIARAHPGKTVLYWNTLSSTRPALPRLGPEALPPAFAKVFAGPVVG